MAVVSEHGLALHELLERRWSPVAFSPQPVEPEKLRSVLEAARWAASSFNEQPWVYLVATKDDPENFQRLLSCLVESNQAWATNAPVLMLSVAKLHFDKNGKPNRHALHDVGAASASLTLQGTALGLFVHQMAGFDAEKARREFSIPEGWEPGAAIALGYLGDDSTLPDKLRERNRGVRKRKPLEEFVFTGGWGKPSAFLKG
ncbi:MAG TPA: nitroreductase family protein [Candidatus Acidoferrales bacterium]|jgi:nitroreductase|nr:nitroreductase family protein [Candidatus Acidoferrales bacterium]